MTILAIDQGTTSTRAILYDVDSNVLGKAQRELPQIYPRPGWVEHDPEEIWAATLEVCRDAIGASGRTPGDVAAIGITNQRETTIVWDRGTGEPIHNAIVWQDRRTANVCAELRADGMRHRMYVAEAGLREGHTGEHTGYEHIFGCGKLIVVGAGQAQILTDELDGLQGQAVGDGAGQ